MNPTDQLVTEAIQQIREATDLQPSTLRPIIKTVIEKATDPFRDKINALERQVNNLSRAFDDAVAANATYERESRAHASEPAHCPDCEGTHCPGLLVDEPAHASAVSKAMDDVPFGDEQEADQQRAREATCPHPQCDGGWLKSEHPDEIGQPCPACAPRPAQASEQEKFPRIQDTPEFKRGMEKADRAAKEKGGER